MSRQRQGDLALLSSGEKHGHDRSDGKNHHSPGSQPAPRQERGHCRRLAQGQLAQPSLSQLEGGGVSRQRFPDQPQLRGDMGGALLSEPGGAAGAGRAPADAGAHPGGDPHPQAGRAVGGQGGHHLQRGLRGGDRSHEPRAGPGAGRVLRRERHRLLRPQLHGRRVGEPAHDDLRTAPAVAQVRSRGRGVPERRLPGQLDEGRGGARRRLQLRDFQRQRGQPGRGRLHVLSDR